MSSPAAADPYGYFEEEPVRGPVAPVPTHVQPALQSAVLGEHPTARHTAKTSKNF